MEGRHVNHQATAPLHYERAATDAINIDKYSCNILLYPRSTYRNNTTYTLHKLKAFSIKGLQTLMLKYF